MMCVASVDVFTRNAKGDVSARTVFKDVAGKIASNIGSVRNVFIRNVTKVVSARSASKMLPKELHLTMCP
jgi:hypothetical protein